MNRDMDVALQRIDALIEKIRAANTYRGRLNNDGELRIAQLDYVKALITEDATPANLPTKETT